MLMHKPFGKSLPMLTNLHTSYAERDGEADLQRLIGKMMQSWTYKAHVYF